MPMFRCAAWIYDQGPPLSLGLITEKLIFSDTRPNAIIQFVNEEVIPANSASEPPLDLNDISIGVEVIPEVPNWQP